LKKNNINRKFFTRYWFKNEVGSNTFETLQNRKLTT
jgi:hypothetical protein